MRKLPQDDCRKLMPLRRIAETSSYSLGYVSILVQRKKLKAKKIGNKYYSTKEWFDQYLEFHGRDGKKLPEAIAAKELDFNPSSPAAARANRLDQNTPNQNLIEPAAGQKIKAARPQSQKSKKINFKINGNNLIETLNFKFKISESFSSEKILPPAAIFDQEFKQLTIQARRILIKNFKQGHKRDQRESRNQRRLIISRKIFALTSAAKKLALKSSALKLIAGSIIALILIMAGQFILPELSNNFTRAVSRELNWPRARIKSAILNFRNSNLADNFNRQSAALNGFFNFQIKSIEEVAALIIYPKNNQADESAAAPQGGRRPGRVAGTSEISIGPKFEFGQNLKAAGNDLSALAEAAASFGGQLVQTAKDKTRLSLVQAADSQKRLSLALSYKAANFVLASRRQVDGLLAGGSGKISELEDSIGQTAKRLAAQPLAYFQGNLNQLTARLKSDYGQKFLELAGLPQPQPVLPPGSAKAPTESRNQSEQGVVVIPFTSDEQATDIKEKVETMFSDEVKIEPDESGRVGIIKPIFGAETPDQQYLYMMVPVNEDEK